MKSLTFEQVVSTTALLFLVRIQTLPEAFAGLVSTHAGELLRYMSQGLSKGNLRFEAGPKANKGLQNKVRGEKGPTEWRADMASSSETFEKSPTRSLTDP